MINKKELRGSMLLYAVTDSMWLHGRTLPESAEEALKGGITFLQIREKELPYPEFLYLAEQLLKKARSYHIPFVVNDEVDIACAIDADGVHIGQSDTALIDARDKLGPGKIIGVSVQTVAQALEAEQNGADYLGVGALYSTSTKPDAAALSHDLVKEICAEVSIPVVGIGGLNASNIRELKGIGLDGAAVVSAVFAADHITNAAEELLHICRETFE